VTKVTQLANGHMHDQVKDFLAEPLKSQATRWRAEWERSTPRLRNDALLAHVAQCLVSRPHGPAICKLTFLGKPLCAHAFCAVTGVNPWRFIKLARTGVQSWEKADRKCSRARYDEMYAAIFAKLELLKDSSPFVRKGVHGDIDDRNISVPFHEKIYLFRTIVLDYEDSARNPERPPLFISKPTYSTFRSSTRHIGTISWIKCANPLVCILSNWSRCVAPEACAAEPGLCEVCVPSCRRHR